MTETATGEGCDCEKRIDPRLLEGYACGRPGCWRTAVVKASFDTFVSELTAAREDAPPRPREE